MYSENKTKLCLPAPTPPWKISHMGPTVPTRDKQLAIPNRLADCPLITCLQMGQHHHLGSCFIQR